MLLEFRKNCIVVRKEVTDRKYGRKESQLYYDIKKVLIAKGYDCIKKLAWKDGHLVDDNMYYLRDRKKRWSLSDALYSVRFLTEGFDNGEDVYLYVNTDEKDWRLCK